MQKHSVGICHEKHRKYRIVNKLAGIRRLDIVYRYLLLQGVHI